MLSRLRKAFDVEQHNETKQASQLMAAMYAAMARTYSAGCDPKIKDHQVSVTLARILFLLFGDDTDMWQPDGFRGYLLLNTAADGSNLQARLQTLFDGLNDPRGIPEAGLPYVNGGVFREVVSLPAVQGDFRKAILDACIVDWSTISPAIFGSMFQSVRDSQTRRALDEHYTSEENILKTLNPLFLDELRVEFTPITTLGKYEADRLRKFRDKIGQIRYMDPACGCGNFIIVAYRELRDLELAIMERLQEITGDGAMLLANVGLKVTLDHFFGIEIDEWPARIAETAMFLIDRQSDLKLTERLGWAPDRLPIQEQATIVSGISALKVDWATICPPTDRTVVAGNPPFLGDHTRTRQQLVELQNVWGEDKTLSRMDYVTGWHAQALQYFGKQNGVWAFVTTNSITQGDQVHRLFSEIFQKDWRIKFSHRTFAWTSEAVGAAAVHCVIVGFTREMSNKSRLFDYKTLKASPIELTVFTINAYLVDGPNVLVGKRTSPLSSEVPEVVKGSMATDGGNLVVTPEQYDEVASDEIARRFLRPYVGSKELISRCQRWCLWLEESSSTERASSPELRRRIAAVMKMRLASTARTTQEFPYHHLFRQRGIVPNEPFVGIPEVSSENRDYVPVAYLEKGTIIRNKVYGAVDPSGLVFSIASSAMFMTWMRTVGGRMKSDLSFSSTITWNNFPLPDLDAARRSALAEAGRQVLLARNLQPDWSLEDHYKPERMTAELRSAHKHLDSMVDAIFGVDASSPSLLQRQEALFALYQELTLH